MSGYFVVNIATKEAKYLVYRAMSVTRPRLGRVALQHESLGSSTSHVSWSSSCISTNSPFSIFCTSFGGISDKPGTEVCTVCGCTSEFSVLTPIGHVIVMADPDGPSGLGVKVGMKTGTFVSAGKN